MSDDLKTNDNDTSREISRENNSNEKSTNEHINKVISELNDLINEIRNSRQISQVIDQSEALNSDQETNQSQTSTQIRQTIEGQASTQNQATKSANIDVNAAILQASQTLAALNSIKTDLCRLPLDFCEREYIDNCINPLLNTTELLSRAGYELATSVSILAVSPIVPRKKGKLKDTIHTIYSMNEESEELYAVLKKRLKKLTQEGNCCKFP